LMCAGIWRPVRLEIYSVRVADLRCEVDIRDDYKLASLQVKATVETVLEHHVDIQAKFTIRLGLLEIASTTSEVKPTGEASAQLQVPEPQLWWPAGYGAQHLYTVEISISVNGMAVHKETKFVGLRTVKLVQEADKHGKSFYFRINGVDIFCGGSCWIPTDSFLTNVTKEKYRAWIELMVPANQKMIRCVIAQNVPSWRHKLHGRLS
jgi:beta-mannosidase